jgi:hypothetical protein
MPDSTNLLQFVELSLLLLYCYKPRCGDAKSKTVQMLTQKLRASFTRLESNMVNCPRNRLNMEIEEILMGTKASKEGTAVQPLASMPWLNSMKQSWN